MLRYPQSGRSSQTSVCRPTPTDEPILGFCAVRCFTKYRYALRLFGDDPIRPLDK